MCYDCGGVNFRCSDGEKCIPESLKCDGVQHCSDGSDEHVQACGDCNHMEGGGFACDDGQCVKAACDGQQECNDRSDDNVAVCGQNCANVEGGGLVCADSQQCIKAAKKCDWQKDCDDLSDEDIDTCGKALGKFHEFAYAYPRQASNGQNVCVFEHGPVRIWP